MNPSVPIPAELIVALQNAKDVVVFTGASVSAESGITTFRDALTGLWERFDAEDLATPDAFRRDRELVWGWYEWRRMQVIHAQPSPAHLAIAELAKFVPRLTVVTQNVDDLHGRAGSSDVLHLHGSRHSRRCASCGQAHLLPSGIPQDPEGGRRLNPPSCTHCGGFIRPGVVWFGESLPAMAFDRASSAAEACELLFVIGTSGLVHPAARIPSLARQAGASVVQVNPTSTGLNSDCTWTLQGAAGVIMPIVVRAAFAVA